MRKTRSSVLQALRPRRRFLGLSLQHDAPRTFGDNLYAAVRSTADETLQLRCDASPIKNTPKGATNSNFTQTMHGTLQHAEKTKATLYVG